MEAGYNNMSFTKWIKKEIQESKYTRQGVADHIDVSKAAVDKWMEGKQYPKVIPLWKLCVVLFQMKKEAEIPPRCSPWVLEKLKKEAVAYRNEKFQEAVLLLVKEDI